jgi:glutathione S-transferase
MPSYKLYYFNGRGRAELARLIFAAAGQQYEDVRYAQDQWPAHKGEFHFGQLPALEVDGTKVAQSAAIAHFLAVQFGLAGKTPVDTFKVHAMAETVRDLGEPLGKIMFEKDEERKKKLREEYETTLKNFLEKFESHLKGASGGFLVGGALSYADLALYNTLFNINNVLGRDVVASHPHLAKHYQAIAAHPHIAAYLAKRAQTPF